MPAKAARTDAILTDMDPSEQDERRRRSLDRLRGTARAERPSPSDAVTPRSPAAAPPAEPATGPGPLAARLADGLGGSAIGIGSAAYAMVETDVHLPFDPGTLADLPDPMAPRAPLLCLDTETTGLGTGAGTVAFMVGLGRWHGERFRVTQLLMPDHPAEPAMLDRLAAELATAGTLVTYNGRQFDWPLLVTRHRLHGRPLPPPARHLDLLPLARSVWRHRLPDARLSSVERGVAGVVRHHDLPGAEAPARYFSWLRDRDPSPLAEVLQHNLQDIISLGLLLRVLGDELLPARSGTVPTAVHPGDLAGLGRVYARRGDAPAALRCLDAALGCETRDTTTVIAGRTSGPDDDPWTVRRAVPGHTPERLLADRARILGRMGRPDEAVGAWEAIALDGGELASLAWIQVAKDREHRRRDPRAALVAARRAAAIAERRRFLGRLDRLAERDLPKRLARLELAVRTATAATPASAPHVDASDTVSNPPVPVGEARP